MTEWLSRHRRRGLEETSDRVMARLNQIQLEWQQGLPGFQSSLEVLSRENAARLGSWTMHAYTRLMQSRDRNRHIASENRVLAQDEGHLKPLLSLSTGEVIDPFPPRVDDVASLPCECRITGSAPLTV